MDGSKQSERIVKVACRLASKFSAKIILMYVSASPQFVEEYIEIPGTIQSSKAAARVKVAEAVPSLEDQIKSAGIPCEVLFESGDPGEKIIESSMEREASMIVIGLKGLHGADKIRSLGSVSRRVIESARCPVVVVPES